MPGTLKQVSVGSSGNVWGVTPANEVRRWIGSGWASVPGTMAQVAVGADGTVWALDPNGNIFRGTP